MKATPKLRRYITISLWILALIMIAAYSFLVQYSLITGIKEVASYDLRLKAQNFEAQYQTNKDAALPGSPYLTAYIGEEKLPDWFKNNYPTQTQAHAKMQWHEVKKHQYGQEEPFFFLAMAYDLDDGNRLYLLEIYTEKDEILGAFHNSKRSAALTLILGIVFIILVLIALRYLFKKVSDPMGDLYDWANNLNQEALACPHPDFYFQEINQLADLIQNSMQNLNQALVREHQFLKFSSHELRTPIAVLRSNIDLLDRLRPHPGNDEKISYQRIRRAVDNMHRMTETLLWLSRKKENMPAMECVDLSGMVEEIVKENRYLLTGKQVTCNLETMPVRITIPRTAGRIALGNLIRNAFQHTAQGQVNICVTQEAFIVKNTEQTLAQAPLENDEYGTGLGLMLVKQITRKLNLHYESQAIPGGYKAVILFPPDHHNVG